MIDCLDKVLLFVSFFDKTVQIFNDVQLFMRESVWNEFMFVHVNYNGWQRVRIHGFWRFRTECQILCSLLFQFIFHIINAFFIATLTPPKTYKSRDRRIGKLDVMVS